MERDRERRIGDGLVPAEPLQGTGRAKGSGYSREGLWLLARWALAHEEWARDNALEVIEVIAPDRVDLVRSVIAEH